MKQNVLIVIFVLLLGIGLCGQEEKVLSGNVYMKYTLSWGKDVIVREIVVGDTVYTVNTIIEGTTISIEGKISQLNEDQYFIAHNIKHIENVDKNGAEVCTVAESIQTCSYIGVGLELTLLDCGGKNLLIKCQLSKDQMVNRSRKK